MPPRSVLRSLLLASLATGCLVEPDDPPDLGATALEVINEKSFSLATGLKHTCALGEGGIVQCWGLNASGQLGDGTTVNRAEPVTVVGITGAVAVTTGDSHSCAVLGDGTARCWGSNVKGQLGDGTNVDRLEPVAVFGLTSVTSLSAGGSHTCATVATKSAKCWGANGDGQLGNNSTTDANKPEVVRTMFWGGVIPIWDAAEVDTGTASSCLRMFSGDVACWGRNNYGQLGDGTTTSKSLAVFANVTAAADVSVGHNHACAVLTDGGARCWGRNESGQLGDASYTNRSTPVAVRMGLWPSGSLPLGNVTAISAGRYHSCLLSNGKAMCMGDNTQLQLGLSDIGSSNTARANIVWGQQISAGGYHSCAVRPGGAIVCFGAGDKGQLGGKDVCPATPTVELVDVTSATGKILSRFDPANTYYTDGTSLDVTVRSSSCATVSEVSWSWGPIGDGDPIEPGTGPTYEVMSSTEQPEGGRVHVVRVSFHNPGNGMSFPASVRVTSPAGQSQSAPLAVSYVHAVNSGVRAGLATIGRDDLYNRVLVGLFDKWGDANYYTKNGVNLYAFDYAGFELTMDPEGIYFRGRTKADLIPGGPVDTDVCNPTGEAWGKFKITATGGEVGVQWVDGPHAIVDFPFGCDAAASLLITPVLVQIGEEIAGEVAEEKVAKRIKKLIERLDDDCGDFSCSLILQDIRHVQDGVEIDMQPLFESVTFRAPYVSTQVHADSVGDPMKRGIAIPASHGVIITAAGVAQACTTQTGDCNPKRFGPAGLFNWNWDPELPIPDPWPCNPDTGACAYLPGRHAAWVMQRGLRRDLTKVRMPGHNPGGLIGRLLMRSDAGDTASNLKYMGDLYCATEPDDGTTQARLVVGRNDVYPGGPYQSEYGTGEALVTIAFIGIGKDCPE